MVIKLPPKLQPIALAALCIPKGIGLAFQALDLGIMCLMGGGAAGLSHGAFCCMAAPFRALSIAGRYGASCLGFLALWLARGGKAAESTATALMRSVPLP